MYYVLFNVSLISPQEGKTVILVTHSPKAVPLASRVVCLEEKKVSFNGSYEDFKGSSEVQEVVHEDPEPEPEGKEARSRCER